MTSPTANSSNHHGKNALEWAVFGLSTLLVLGAIGFLIYSAVAGDDRPADLRVSIKKVSTRSGTTVAEVDLRNEGLRTAAEVTVEVTARYGDEEKISTVLIDFVPKGGSREGILIFPGTQAPDQLTPRILGYVEP